MCMTNAVDLEKDDGHDTSNIITLNVPETLVV